MKTHVISFKEPSSLFALIFNPHYSFESEWCLDMYGFLNREEFNDRLVQINREIANLPLISAMLEKVLLWVSGIVSLIAAAFISGFVLEGALKGGGSGSMLLTALLVSRKYLISRMAEDRAKKFTEALENLFKRFNSQDNPTANWSVVWVPIISKYKIEVTSLTVATAKPKYVEQVKVFLDISDSLSDLTSHTVHVNIKPERERIEPIPRRQENTVTSFSTGVPPNFNNNNNNFDPNVHITSHCVYNNNIPLQYV